MLNPTLLRNFLDTLDVKPEIELFASSNFLYIVHSGVTQRPLVFMHSPSHGLRKIFILFHLLVVFSECFRKLFRTGQQECS